MAAHLFASLYSHKYCLIEQISYFCISSQQPLASVGVTASASKVESLRPLQQKGRQPHLLFLSSQFENWGDSAMADASPRTDTSTDLDIDEKNQMVTQITLFLF